VPDITDEDGRDETKKKRTKRKKKRIVDDYERLCQQLWHAKVRTANLYVEENIVLEKRKTHLFVTLLMLTISQTRPRAASGGTLFITQ
jgi:hypothetical protein